MIGNDLVDLEQAALDSNWQRKGYLDKICTRKEQQLVLNAKDPARMLWLIWSIKEAAYKIENRLTNKRFYAPKEFSCEYLSFDDKQASAEVNYKSKTYFTRSAIELNKLHSTALLNPADYQTIHIWHSAYSDKYIQEFNSVSSEYLLSKDKEGLPFVYSVKTDQRYAASVSHHGKFLAVIYSDSLLLTD